MASLFHFQSLTGLMTGKTVLMAGKTVPISRAFFWLKNVSRRYFLSGFEAFSACFLLYDIDFQCFQCIFWASSVQLALLCVILKKIE